MAENPLSPITPIAPPRPRVATAKVTPLARTEAPVAAVPAADAAAKPVEPPPPAANPLGAPASARPGTIKLKPILRQVSAERTQKIVLERPVAAEVRPKLPEVTAKIPDLAVETGTGTMDALKRVTQDLKSVTSPIPPSAVLHKTGLIADINELDVQKEASKNRTTRISLSSALGAAPVLNETPTKTIRIKRPSDIPGVAPIVPKPEEAAADAAAPSDEVKDLPAAEGAAGGEKGVSVTQRKTLKIARPAKLAKSAGAAAKSADDSAEGEVKDLPADEPVNLAPLPPARVSGSLPGDVSNPVKVIGLVVQIAACVVVGFLGWCLYNDWQLPMFCGGCQ